MPGQESLQKETAAQIAYLFCVLTFCCNFQSPCNHLVWILL